MKIFKNGSGALVVEKALILIRFKSSWAKALPNKSPSSIKAAQLMNSRWFAIFHDYEVAK